jgi:aminopeptidase N
VGADVFGDIMQSFLETHAYQNAATGDFFETVRQVTGEDYGWFFDQWLMKPGHPVLAVNQEWDDDRDVLTITVRQEQDRSLGTPVFRLPLAISITTGDETLEERVWLDESEQSFNFEVSYKPLMVRIDANDILLKELRFEKSTTQLMYQLRYDSAVGRRWAVGELEQHLDSPGAVLALVAASQADDFWAVRERAVRALGELERNGDEPDASIALVTRSQAGDVPAGQDRASGAPGFARTRMISDALMRSALQDENSRVRAAAIQSLASGNDQSLADFFEERQAAEESPLARAAAATALESLSTP